MKSMTLLVMSFFLVNAHATKQESSKDVPIITSPSYTNYENLKELAKDEIKKSLELTNTEIKQELSTQLQTQIKTQSFLNNMIDASKVKKISYLLASNKGMGRSSFGHSYLRISLNDELSNEDITYEFVADVANEDLEIMRGIGFGENYGIKIDSGRYEKVLQYHAIKENRDLTTYVLNLNDDQKNKIISKINELVLIGTKKTYAFFTNNCADIVTDVLNAGLNNKITGPKAIVPIMIPSLLKNNNLIKDEVIDLRRSELIKNIVMNKFQDKLTQTHPYFGINLQDQLSSERFNERLKGYLKLHLLTKELEFTEALKVISMVNSMAKYENRHVRHYLRKLFATKKTKVYEYARIKYKLGKGNYKVLNQKLNVEDNQVLLEVNVKKPGKKRIKLQFELNHLEYKKGRILHGDHVISYNLGENLIKGKFYNPSTYNFMEITQINKQTYLTSILLSEKKSFQEKINNDFTKFDDEIIYKNTKLAKFSPGGMCDTHAELTQKLKMNTIFAPELPRLDEDSYLELINKSFQNNIVVIPGFNNAKELTTSLSFDKLGPLMAKRQQTKMNPAVNYLNSFNTTQLTSENIYILENLIELGIKPSLSFEVERIPNGLSYISIGHAVIVDSIYKKSGIYYLDIIDPNMTYQKGLYKFDPITNTLDTKIYGTVDPELQKFNVHQSYSLTLLAKDKYISDVLRIMAKRYKKYSFDIQEVLQ